MFNSKIQGWMNYCMKFYKSEMYSLLRYVNQCLVKWVRCKYKKRQARRKVEHWWGDCQAGKKVIRALENWNITIDWIIGDG